MSQPLQPVLVAGAGYVGQALIARLRQRGYPVYAMRRNPAPAQHDEVPLTLDLSAPSSLESLPTDIGSIVYLLSPDASTEQAYATAYVDALRNLLASDAVKRGSVQRLLFASSTAVYGQNDGSRVDEDSPTEPQRFSGRYLLQAEQLVRNSGLIHTSIRFAGIYGPGRQRLLTQVLEERAVVLPEPTLTNRIHRDDCAGFLQHLLELPQPQPVYIGVDDEPVELRVVLEWLASKTGKPGPSVDPNAPRGRGGNKYCVNQRLHDTGYSLRYPNFRAGYAQLLPSRR